jgi:hypothetical protein
MNAKLLFRSSAGMLFFLLLFSKPYIARCQNSTSGNKPVMKEVRIEIDSTIDANGNVNAKKTIFIDGKEMPADFEWVEANMPPVANTQKKVIIINTDGDGNLPPLAPMPELNGADANGLAIIIKEVETTNTKKHLRKHGKQPHIEMIEMVR